MIEVAIVLAVAYLLGSIPSAYLAGKWGKGIDLRQVGSGNLGFTNAWRMLGPRWSIPVLIFDMVKGMPGIYLSYSFQPENDWLAIIAGLVAIFGHNWTIYLGFQGGGKGVATSAGVFLALTPVCFIIALAVFLLTAFGTKYISLGSIMGALTLVFCAALFRGLNLEFAPSGEIFLFILIAAVLVIVRHRSNIQRLLRGEEGKFTTKREEME